MKTLVLFSAACFVVIASYSNVAGTGFTKTNSLTISETNRQNETDSVPHTSVISTENYLGNSYYIVETDGKITGIKINGHDVPGDSVSAYSQTVSDIRLSMDQRWQGFLKNSKDGVDKRLSEQSGTFQNKLSELQNNSDAELQRRMNSIRKGQ